ncbi:unnamed protein product [Brassicogethes aeneus]|uniref:Uncharacterized protein n=1 Tax=Brassicogethes aeneus TaxID=1431903 RepID=A0A9P0FKR0_BRAAE|nr:unnamed protein product [Brassicogethes aeneus]
MDLENTEIKECYRVGNLSNNKPRSVFVKLKNYADKVEIIKNRKKLKGTKIHIKEDLTKNKMEILTAASEKFGYKNVWSLNGKDDEEENNDLKPALTQVALQATLFLEGNSTGELSPSKRVYIMDSSTKIKFLINTGACLTSSKLQNFNQISTATAVE